MRVDPIHHRTISEGCPLPQLEAATHTIPLLIISQVRAEIQAGMREFVLHILERGTQRHFQITFFRAGGSLSTTKHECPSSASAHAKFATVAVFPAPPF